MKRYFLPLVASLAIGSLVACGGESGEGGEAVIGQSTISVLSSRPDMVTDGSALISVSVPEGVLASDMKVAFGTTDVTSMLQASGGSLAGVVTGLVLGDNKLTVQARSQSGVTSTLGTLTVRNHDRNGPIISGPHQTPWLCQTADKKLPDGSSLGPAQDANCNAATKVMYVYRPVAGAAFKPLPSTSSLPADLATTVTTDGRTVNYIVRLETGTINRVIYQFATLHDPTVEMGPSPSATYRGWNRKLMFAFGGSVSTGYTQGTQAGNEAEGVLQDDLLSRGFAVIGSSGNVFGNNPSDVLSAESVSMVKERFIKTYGVPIYTMGWGASGGAMQQYLIANNYPGLLDGITPGFGFADLFTVLPGTQDCPLLKRAFSGSSELWTPEQKTAVAGFANWTECDASAAGGGNGWMQNYAPTWMLATQTSMPTTTFNLPAGPLVVDFNNCKVDVPRSLTYHPITNPQGIRCDVFSGIRNLLGTDPSTGNAPRAFDNVGVQYGLKAFKAGAISGEQFVQLNEGVGGYDQDGNFQAVRTAASELALNNLFEFGRVNQAANLANLPIIDWRPFSEHAPVPDIHDTVRSMTVRARLTRANGSADNHVVLRFGAVVPSAEEVIRKMDQWLMNLRNDTRQYASVREKVVANKPADAVDACYPSVGQKIVEAADINNGGQCGQLMPFYANPRLAAGEPLVNDVLKCQLKPLVRAEYADLSESQFARLSAVFPSGTCDYSKQSVGAKPLKAPWLSYSTPGIAASLN